MGALGRDPVPAVNSGWLGVGAIAPLAVVLSLGCGARQAAPRAEPVVFTPGTQHIYSVTSDGSRARSLDISGVALARGTDGRIAFLQGKRLAVMNDDGSGLRVLAQANRGSEDPVAPSWSPDGREIAAGAGQGCEPTADCQSWSVSIIDVATAKRRAVVPFGREPSWSPDGRKIAFAGGSATGDRQTKTQFAVFVARPDGRGRTQLIAGGGLPIWSPTGKVMAFYGRLRRGAHRGIHLIRPDGTKQRLVARAEPVFAWSPEGRRLAYLGPFGFPDRLEVLSLASGRRTRIGADTFSNVGAVAWAPNGSRLAYVRYDDAHDEDQLLIVPADGSRKPLEIFRTGPRQRIWTPVFSADGGRILYSVWQL